MARLQKNINPVNSDRVADSIFEYAAQDAKLKLYSPLQTSREDIVLKLSHYSNIYSAFRKTASGQEKDSLKYLRFEMARLNAKLNPNFFNRFFYSEIADSIRELFRGKSDPVAYFQKEIQQIEKDILQEHNVQSLSASMKKMGFQVEMEAQLRKMINHDFPQFHFRYNDATNPDAHYVLHFEKIPDTGLYYFESFEAIKLVSLDAVLNKDMSCPRHKFHLQDGVQMNASESAKLVNGKSICKSIDGKETWLVLDSLGSRFQRPYQSVSFNLEKALSNLPIKEKQNPSEYQKVIEALKAGRKKEVTLVINNAPVKYYIEASPPSNTVYVLDKAGHLVDTNRLLKGQAPELTKQVVAKISQEKEEAIDIGEMKMRVR